MKYKNCGHEIRFCSYCGLPVNEIESVKPQPSISLSSLPCTDVHSIPKEEKVNNQHKSSPLKIHDLKTNQLLQDAIMRKSFTISFPLPENVFAKTRKRRKKDK
jgi:hypothetical protein